MRPRFSNLKRQARSWRLYLRLKCGKCENVVTTNEAMFYTGASYGRVSTFVLMR